ncbi:MAG: NAD-binding protein [Erysipelotrichaceae bacterium]|jgi:trk system potassium uptake protein TrkA|nr:NAD-binding protein [Erysipelotrichaceae bacterium]
MKKEKILIIGSQQLGVNIAEFYSLRGDFVLVIDKNKDAFERLKETNYSGKTSIGDASTAEVLDANEVSSFKRAFVVTNSDNSNIYIALLLEKMYGISDITISIKDETKAALVTSPSVKTIMLNQLLFNAFLEGIN